MSGTASGFAKKGVSRFLSVTKSGLSALSDGVNKARKTYASKHESSVLMELKNKGLGVSDHTFEALLRVYFLYLSGYKHEIVASGLQAGKRLTDAERSSVPLDIVIIFGHSVCEECLKHGDFEKGTVQQKLVDFMNKAKMGKEHIDRDSLVHDIYYALLIGAETMGTEWPNLEMSFREATARVIENSIHASTNKDDAKKKAAKALYMFASQIRSCAQEAEQKKQKALKDAEDLLRIEQERQTAVRQSLSRVSQ